MKRQRLAGTERIERTHRRRQIPVGPVDVGTHAGRIKECRRFTETAAGGQNDTGDDTGGAGRHQNAADSLPFRRAKSHAAVTVRKRQCVKRISRRRCDERKTEDRDSQGAGHQVPFHAGHQDEDEISEESDDD